MPRSTFSFPFEEKLLNFAIDYSNKRFGDVVYFCLALDASGVVTQVSTVREPRSPRLQMPDGTLEFDPFEWPEYAWMAWGGISREQMERLVGHKIEDSELASGNERLGAFPETWSVMF